MASIQVGGGHGSTRKAVDSDLPLVPFIDLLFCCVAFLLVTAVWNQMAAVEVSAPTPGPASPVPSPSLTLSITAEGWTLATAEGARLPVPSGDHAALAEALRTRRVGEDELVIATDDGVPYETVIAAIDVAVGAGIRDVSMAGGAASDAVH